MKPIAYRTLIISTINQHKMQYDSQLAPMRKYIREKILWPDIHQLLIWGCEYIEDNRRKDDFRRKIWFLNNDQT